MKDGTFPERKALIRNFVEGIEVVGDEATLTYTIPMPNDGVTSESASVLDFVQSGPPEEARTPRKDRCAKDHRAPSHISNMVPPTTPLGPPSCIVDRMALRGLLGDEARVSASTVARLKEKWHAELAEWRQRPLDDLEVVYMWVDGGYVKAGLEKEKAAILVVLAALSDGSKVVVTAMPGYRGSTESWSEVLRGLKERGLECPRLVIGDGHLGIWGALRNVYPEAAEQRCWNHKILNVLDKLPKREQAQAKQLLCRIPYSQSRKEAERLSSIFSRWCHERAHQAASEALERDWERMVTFYDFPREHWQHLRTTNPVESPFAALRLRTDAAKRYKRVDRATAVIWKMLMIAEKRFRRLKAPGLMRDVDLGTLYMDGKAIKATVEEVAAWCCLHIY